MQDIARAHTARVPIRVAWGMTAPLREKGISDRDPIESCCREICLLSTC